IVLFGRPGSGKSSLGERLSAEHGYTPIRTGELLREAVHRRDAIGVMVEEQIKRGDLVADSIIEQLLVQSLGEPGHQRWLFDGFPRTLGQVAILQKLKDSLKFRIDCFLEIAIDRATATAQMAGRRVCPVCGATYHVQNKPPKVPETCDIDGSPLEQRPD